MPINLLRRLAEGPLPTTVTQPGEVLQVRMLQAAGYVYAKIPFPRAEGWHWRQGPATVYQVTALGYKAMRWFGPPHSDAPEKDREG